MWPQALVCYVALTGAVSAQYDNCRVLDCDNGMQLQWSIRGNTLLVAMEARAMGYVAVGLSAGGPRFMTSSSDPTNTPSDIIAGWAVHEGMAMEGPPAGVRDYHVSNYASPTLDLVQDVALVSATFSPASGITRIEWSRALNTGDTDEDRVITPGTPQTVIWATNPAAQTVSMALSLTRHLATTRGHAVLDFGAPSTCPINECGAALDPVARYQAQRASCISNGWPPAEASGDARDGGAAHPRIVVQRQVNITRAIQISSTSFPTTSSTATATRSGSLTASGSPSLSPGASPSWSRTLSPSSTLTPSASASAPRQGTTFESLVALFTAADSLSAPMLTSGSFSARWAVSETAVVPLPPPPPPHL